MTDAWSVSNILTHYHKIGHLQLVTYAIYTVKEDAMDQYLLELELQIRHQHPHILLIYYNKSLYHFSLDEPKKYDGGEHDNSAGSGSSKLHLLYPQLILQHENTVAAGELANPSRVAKSAASRKKGKDDSPVDEHLAFASLSFLKAVKKCIVYSLSLSGQMQIFGNYLVARAPGSSFQKTVVQTDPILLGNGDLIVSLSQRNSLKLFETLALDVHLEMADYANSFVIYVLPSGLRCHLYDTVNYEQNFTYVASKSSENLLRLLKYSMGVDLTKKKQILWAKLIPNLQHLNNQTSNISHFVHDVENKKYILWPWELCLLQFGSVEECVQTDPDPSAKDPLSLVSDFLQFSINCHNAEPALKPPVPEPIGLTDPGSVGNIPPFSIPSALSTGASTGGEETKHETQMLNQVPNIFLQDDTFFDPSDPNVGLEPKHNATEQPKSEEEDLEDLFGYSLDSDTKKNTQDEGSADEKQEDIKKEENDFKEDHEDFEQDNETENVQKSPASRDSNIQEESDVSFQVGNKQTGEESFINIPRDQMITAPFEPLTTTYDDPGAPLPIMPTPILQSTPFHSLTANTAQAKPPAEAKKGGRGLSGDGYVFSPISFNPKIRSSIDTKYGKGGKFYVAREASSGPEESRSRLRETSVYNATDLPFRREVNSSAPETEEAFLDGIERRDERGEEREGERTEPAEMQRTDRGDTMRTDRGDTFDDTFHMGIEDVEDEDDEDEEEDDDEESDVDEEFSSGELRTSPLKLNTTLGDIFHWPPALAVDTQKQTQASFALGSGLLSPGQTRALGSKGESPFGTVLSDAQYLSFSPMPAAEKAPSHIDTAIGDEAEKKEEAAPASGAGELTNCLPLILRSINVYSIPSRFLLRNALQWGGVALAPGFDMDVDNDDDFDSPGALSVRAAHLDEFLHWLTGNLVFSGGGRARPKRMRLCAPARMLEEAGAPQNSAAQNGAHIKTGAGSDSVALDGEVSPEVARVFASVFPLSYQIALGEFVTESEQKPLPADDQLFLGDMGENGPGDVFWHTLAPEQQHRGGFERYRRQRLDKPSRPADDAHVFSTGDVKATVLKNDDTLNVSVVGTRLWRHLNFRPVGGPKRFQVVLISEASGGLAHDAAHDWGDAMLGFLAMLQSSFRENHLGSISPLSLQPPATRPDLEGISNGLMLVPRAPGTAYRDFYKSVDRRLWALAELVKLDLINKTRRFDFGRPLLVLFVSFDQSLAQALQHAKLCRNLRLFLSDHRLAVVELFSHVVAGDQVVRQSRARRRLRYLLAGALARLSLALYDKCPARDARAARLHTHLVRAPPETLALRWAATAGRESFHDGVFLHVAYERSVDKRWICAAWLDPLGLATGVRLWFCPRDGTGHSLEHVIGALWTEASALLRRLAEGPATGKRFLVLTRISSIIPDDELVFWKQLTAKNKDVSLVVVSTSRLPRSLFAQKDGGAKVLSPETAMRETEMAMKAGAGVEGMGAGESEMGTMSTMGAMGTMGAAIMGSDSGVEAKAPGTTKDPGEKAELPLAFLRGAPFMGAPFLGLSPPEAPAADYVLRDPRLDIVGVVPRTPLPSFNSPTRFGLRTGYLVRETRAKRYLVFEVTLLSCLAHWSLGGVMRLLLHHYKKLMVLNDILGVAGDEVETLVPWHINAVVKTVDYLVHVNVDQATTP